MKQMVIAGFVVKLVTTAYKIIVAKQCDQIWRKSPLW